MAFLFMELFCIFIMINDGKTEYMSDKLKENHALPPNDDSADGKLSVEQTKHLHKTSTTLSKKLKIDYKHRKMERELFHITDRQLFHFENGTLENKTQSFGRVKRCIINAVEHVTDLYGTDQCKTESPRRQSKTQTAGPFKSDFTIMLLISAASTQSTTDKDTTVSPPLTATYRHKSIMSTTNATNMTFTTNTQASTSVTINTTAKMTTRASTMAVPPSLQSTTTPTMVNAASMTRRITTLPETSLSKNQTITFKTLMATVMYTTRKNTRNASLPTNSATKKGSAMVTKFYRVTETAPRSTGPPSAATSISTKMRTSKTSTMVTTTEIPSRSSTLVFDDVTAMTDSTIPKTTPSISNATVTLIITVVGGSAIAYFSMVLYMIWKRKNTVVPADSI